MSIEKRLINGQAVGFDTKTNSYCNLPKDFVDAEEPGADAKAPDADAKKPDGGRRKPEGGDGA